MKDDIPKEIIIRKNKLIFKYSEKPDATISPKPKEFDANLTGTYKRIFTVPHAIIDNKKPKTVGSLAAKNTERMIKEGKLQPKQDKIPFWRKSKKIDKSLASLNQKQKREYIMTGRRRA